MLHNPNSIMAQKLKAKMAVDEFLADAPSIIEIQTYVQMARNDVARDAHDFYAKHVIQLLSGDSD